MIANLNDEEDSGIESIDYVPIMELSTMSAKVLFGDAQPLAESVKAYNPEKEQVVMVLEVTPTLPQPKIWFDIFPYE